MIKLDVGGGGSGFEDELLGGGSWLISMMVRHVDQLSSCMSLDNSTAI